MFTNRKKSKTTTNIPRLEVADGAAMVGWQSSCEVFECHANFHSNRPRSNLPYCFRMELVIVAVVVLNLFQLVLANPVFVNNPSLAHFQSGRNIRHLPCVARKSGLSGICMFAIDCIKANGTHLGTCIDRFYFGSCCQIQDESVLIDQEISDNSIDQNTISHFQHESTTLPASDLFKITTPKPTTTTSATAGPFDEIIASSIQNITTAIIKDAIATIIPIYNKPKPSEIQNSTESNVPSSTISMSGSGSTIDNASTSSSSSSSTSVTSSPATSTTPIYSTNTPETVKSEAMTTTLSILTTTGLPKTEPTRTTTIPTKVTTFQIVHDEITTIMSTTLPPSTPQPTTLPPIIPPPRRPTRRPVTNKTTTQKATTTTTTEEMTTLLPTRPTLAPMNSINTETTKKPPRTTTHKPYSTTKRNIVKRPGTKRPSSSTSNRKPPKRPITTYSPNKRNSTKTTTKKPSKYTTTTIRTPITTTVPTTIKSTKAPRPKPKPTAAIVKVPPTIVTEEATHRESTTHEMSATEEPTTTSASTTMKLTTQAASTTVTPASTVTFSPSTEQITTLVSPAENLSKDSSTLEPSITTEASSTTEISRLTTTSTSTSSPTPPTTIPALEIKTTTLSTSTSPRVTPSSPTTTPELPPETSEQTTTSFSTSSTTTTRQPPSTTKLPPSTTTTSSPPTTTEMPIPLTTTMSISSQQITTTTPTTVEMTTSKTEFVTWTDAESAPTNLSAAVNESEIEPETWQPILPPDWVPLPTIKPSMNATSSEDASQPTLLDDVPTKGPEQTLDMQPSTTTSEEIFSLSTDSTTSGVLTSSEMTEGASASSTTNLDLTTEGLSSTNITAGINETISTSTNVSSSTAPPVSFEGIDYKQICGKRMFPEPRIVGGSNAAFGRWPWQISLRQWRTSTYLHKCGAALLNENWAITAAHCVDNVPPSDLLLRLGEYDLAEEEEPYGYQERRVQIVASHPQFDPRTFEYDLALLRFYEPVTFQPNIIPVCVPEDDTDFIGQTAYVTGWGRLYEDGPLPSVLQEVSVPVINNTICETMYRSAGYIEHIPHIFICAGWKKGGYDSCEGDSGGPMVLQRDDKRFLLGGVISWGIGCAEPNQPGVYTRISEFRDWINQILQF